MGSIIPVKNNFLFRLFRKFGHEYFESRYLKGFFKNIDYPKPLKGKILIYAGIGHMYLTPLEVLMYHLLRSDGYSVDYYIYDQSVPINEVITNERISQQGKDSFWNRSVNNAENFLKASNVKYEFISFSKEVDKIIDPVKEDLNEILSFMYDGINFGEIVRGVMYRFYKSTNFGDTATLRGSEFLKTSLANYLQVKSLNEKNNYKYIFFSHGIYCTWQPVVEYCKKNNTPFVCYDRAKKKSTANFNLNQPSPDWSFNNAWERFKDRELTGDEEKKVDIYLGERELQKEDVYAYNSSEKENDLLTLKANLKIKPEAKVITIFTNLIWDAANVARDIAFSSTLDCIEQTINYYHQNENIHILIRCHPAEKVLGTQERYGQLVREKFHDRLPKNVTIIEPEMDINSFTVIDISDIGVVNTSTVGLEFALANKPIILISETNYRNKGFTYDVTSASDYFSKIDMLLKDKMTMPCQVRLARKYFYMMMFLYQKKVPLKFKRNIFNGYEYKDFNSVSACEGVKKIIGALKNKNLHDFIFWD
ncbi:MAG TPA: hypothetical protein VMU83_17820 [Hanamia sp.]|nr:hypothetical protein [Hanamia sp.]